MYRTIDCNRFTPASSIANSTATDEIINSGVFILDLHIFAT